MYWVTHQTIVFMTRSKWETLFEIIFTFLASNKEIKIRGKIKRIFFLSLLLIYTLHIDEGLVICILNTLLKNNKNFFIKNSIKVQY